MGWQIALALVVMVPVMLIPIALVWYLNIGGIISVVKRARSKRTIQEER